MLRIFRTPDAFRLGRGTSGDVRASGVHLLTALAAVAAADVIERAPDENGPRVAVISPSLGGAFYWCRDEARRRVQTHFPQMLECEVRRVVNAIRARVKIASSPAHFPRRRGGFAHSWRDEKGLDCFE